jgi:hypothetical protein
MKKITRVMLILVVLLLLSVITFTCESETELSEEDKVRAYADLATETTLRGLSENDLSKYTRYGNDDIIAAVTQEILDASSTQINNQFGAYESKELLSIEKQEGYTIVHYKATYTKDQIGIRMVFDNDQLVAGQWFE